MKVQFISCSTCKERCEYSALNPRPCNINWQDCLHAHKCNEYIREYEKMGWIKLYGQYYYSYWEPKDHSYLEEELFDI